MSEYSTDESEDKMSIDEAKSQNSEVEAEEDEEEFETITISEVPDERYDQNIDMTEEKETMEKLKRTFNKNIHILYIYIYIKQLFKKFYLLISINYLYYISFHFQMQN